jgi:hypothetical protein
MVWDRGPYESQDGVAIDEQLTLGKIDVVLHGKKLRGTSRWSARASSGPIRCVSLTPGLPRRTLVSLPATQFVMRTTSCLDCLWDGIANALSTVGAKLHRRSIGHCCSRPSGESAVGVSCGRSI